MTIGIYALWFGEDPRPYIGQSSNIEKRFCQQTLKCKNRSFPNKLVRKVCATQGLPKLEILDTCEVTELDLAEWYWIHQYIYVLRTGVLNRFLPTSQRVHRVISKPHVIFKS